ncbi:hypothetical protein B0H16DRAFT_1547415, partial [Mycena metata]
DHPAKVALRRQSAMSGIKSTFSFVMILSPSPSFTSNFLNMSAPHPLSSQAALVSENIAFMVTVNMIILILLSIAVETSDFLVLPLTIEWFTLVLAALYLLVRESRPRGSPSFSGALVMFGAELVLGLITSIALTLRAWQGSTLCDEFAKLPKPCSVALAMVGLSWLAATTGGFSRLSPPRHVNQLRSAFAGILLSFVPPLYRLYQVLCARRRKVNPQEHAIELTNLPSDCQSSYNGGKDQWTDIPV